jgi:hypothetical protein
MNKKTLNAQRPTLNAQLEEKIDKAQGIIRAAMEAGTRPVVLSSFGKDSMVLVALVRATVKRDVFSAHAFPLPVIYWRDPWFAHKHKFADEIIRTWAMEVHDYMPAAAGVKAKGRTDSRHLELVARYSLGLGYIDLPKNVCPPEDYPRRDYLCGLRDWILRPKAGALSFPFDVLLHGHKSSDVDPFEGSVPLRSEREQLNDKLQLFFPLRDWTDDDVWQYLERNHVPVQRERYHAAGGPESMEAKWHGNDYTHACTACIDPTVTEPKVFCPKLKSFVPNVGSRVLQLQGLPDYIMPAGQHKQLEEVS